MAEPIYDGRKALPWAGEGGGLYWRSFGPHARGFVHDGHRHYQDHWTILLTGSVRVFYRSAKHQDVERSAVFIAPYKFEVVADTYHRIEVLEDGTSWSCCFVAPAEADTRAISYHDERPEDPTEKFDG